jgi:hypothetical protein
MRRSTRQRLRTQTGVAVSRRDASDGSRIRVPAAGLIIAGSHRGIHPDQHQDRRDHRAPPRAPRSCSCRPRAPTLARKALTGPPGRFAGRSRSGQHLVVALRSNQPQESCRSPSASRRFGVEHSHRHSPVELGPSSPHITYAACRAAGSGPRRRSERPWVWPAAHLLLYADFGRFAHD